MLENLFGYLLANHLVVVVSRLKMRPLNFDFDLIVEKLVELSRVARLGRHHSGGIEANVFVRVLSLELLVRNHVATLW